MFSTLRFSTFDAYRELGRNLKHNESLLHIDFSENYSCKYSKEIQSVHFGGSHQQASLHTGVLYTAGEEAPRTFCSISPSRRHEPVAIWAHLDPVLKRSADRIVAHGGDIPDAQSLYDKLKSLDTSAELFFVPERDIESKTEEVTLADVPLSSDQSPACGKTPDNPRRPEMIELKHIGEWCVVNYYNDAYPGVIMDVEGHNVKVKCLHRNGINKFHWPSLREDIYWYHDCQILCLIPEPQALNRRSLQIEPSAWKYVEEQLEN
ncbi:hypothetical protein SKAU_G00413190 [Synaphobranchus kaupii]|uniref:Uncharacterized protein n=1 Tax=Synaphobranchus kaupii TaxID=118154 RepID=A0A9Q1E877_SYNKA|nr:hypothetical protein SKAU_G00413190 [Synaphobranchus kaupii]